jgi:Extensin-like protein C-terminus
MASSSALLSALLTLALSGCAAHEAGRGTSASDPSRSGLGFAFMSHGPEDPTDSPAYRYGVLDRPSCEAELDRRHVPWTRVGEARGVLAPVRLTGPVRGIAVHSILPPKQRAAAPIEILDCRLVLALDDFAQILARYNVVEIVHMSVYRPPSKRWPEGKIGRRHPGALAIDAGRFVRRDGTILDVEKDFHGRIGAKTCGPDAGPSPATAEAVALRGIVCEAADARLFNVALTPDYNWQHRNHLHLEVTARVKWFLVH